MSHSEHSLAAQPRVWVSLFGNGAVQPIHVLLALLRDRDGVASQLLAEAGLDYGVARREVRARPDVS